MIKSALQVATEGDAFHLAFHDPVDAVGWALNVQQVTPGLSHSCCHPTKFNISAITERDRSGSLQALLAAPWSTALLKLPAAKASALLCHSRSSDGLHDVRQLHRLHEEHSARVTS